MKRLTATVVLAVSLVAPAAHAEPDGTGVPGIRASIAKVRFRDDGNADRYFVMQPAQKTHSTATKVNAAIGFGFLGMLLGGWIGADLNKNCGCKDPGLGGGIVGMQIGAAAGAVAGWWLASR